MKMSWANEIVARLAKGDVAPGEKKGLVLILGGEDVGFLGRFLLKRFVSVSSSSCQKEASNDLI